MPRTRGSRARKGGSGSVSIEQVMNDLDALALEFEASTEREIAAMREEGLEPADRAGEMSAAVDGFGFTLRDAGGGVVEVRLSLGTDDGTGCVWGDLWPRPGAPVEAGALVAALADAWPALAGRRLIGGSASDATADVSPAGLPPLRILREGDLVTLAAQGTRRDMAEDSVLAVEVLRALGDAACDAARREGRPEAAAWESMSAGTDLPPWPVEGRDDADGEVEWYAAKVGLSTEDYRLGALEAMTRQAEFAAGRTGEEPGPEDWDPGTGPTTDAGTVLARAASAAAAVGRTPEEFGADAVANRNHDARRIHVFGRPVPVRDEPEPMTP